MKKIILPGLIAGIAALFVTVAISIVESFVAPSITAEYSTSTIFRSFRDPLMSLMYIHPFIMGIALSFAWDKTKNLFHQRTPLFKGIAFGLIFWLVAGFSGMFITYSTFLVSLPLIISWSITGILESVVIGVVAAFMNKGETVKK